ncbi:RNA helicase [Pseudomonas syringae]|uniref:RNA helicase n=1 Tax=Pseudomonas syringae pv. syringae TaxID=321 RepID=A0AAE5SAL6_PSESY|nr:RNA helicase [Pseudomonas syringae]POQ05497.1 RNA helicase [Pseudomonas syringae pv. syringae]
MPISAIDGCSAEHWVEVKNIITEALISIDSCKIDVKLVSEQDDVGVIQKRIVQNVYSSDIVVCDVSCKNPNVMFELGMRLAFDKPTVIIKDDKTDYSFDTGVIEHISYPRDLRFGKITAFKVALSEKVMATLKVGLSGDDHSFLKSFGTFSVSVLEQKPGSPDQVIIEMLQDLSSDVARLKRANYAYGRDTKSAPLRISIRGALERLAMQSPSHLDMTLIGNTQFYDHILGVIGFDGKGETLHHLIDEELSRILALGPGITRP